MSGRMNAKTMEKQMFYTETELRLMELFSDGLKHPMMRVLDCIKEVRNDPQISKPNMAKTIQALRKKLPNGREIHCVSEGTRRFYIMTRKLG